MKLIKLPMKKLTILLFSILISFSSYGEWTYLNESEDGTVHYIDTDSINVVGKYVYYWILDDQIELSKVGGMSTAWYIKGECGINREKALSGKSYKQKMGKGKVHDSHTFPDSKKWNYPAPGTTIKTQLDWACNYAK
jgi:hypothetical protein